MGADLETYIASDYKSGAFEPASQARGLTGTADRSRGAPLVASTLRGRSHGEGVNMPGRGGEEAYGDNLIPTLAYALAARDSKGTNTREGTNTLMPSTAGVRRLTPLECERLMGWPDDHTRYAADGREISDSHRYRMCGNGVVASVAEWIGHRLVSVDAMQDFGVPA